MGGSIRRELERYITVVCVCQPLLPVIILTLTHLRCEPAISVLLYVVVCPLLSSGFPSALAPKVCERWLGSWGLGFALCWWVLALAGIFYESYDNL